MKFTKYPWCDSRFAARENSLLAVGCAKNRKGKFSRAQQKLKFCANTPYDRHKNSDKICHKDSALSQLGFTIIEVALVLAIAGLIFLVVFLALPALQRSQRDTAKKQDVARVVAAIQAFKTNNGGANMCPGTSHFYIVYDKQPSSDYPLQYYIDHMAMIDQVRIYGCDNAAGNQWIIGEDYYHPDSSGYYRIEIGINKKCGNKTTGKVYNTTSSVNSYAVMARLDSGSSDNGAWNYICEDA